MNDWSVFSHSVLFGGHTIIGPGAHLISPLTLLFFLFFFFLLKRPLQSSVGIGMKFGGIVLQVNNLIHIDWRSRISDMTSYFQDGGHGVISCRTVLPSCECTRSVSGSGRRICSSVRQSIVAYIRICWGMDVRRWSIDPSTWSNRCAGLSIHSACTVALFDYNTEYTILLGLLSTFRPTPHLSL